MDPLYEVYRALNAHLSIDDAKLSLDSVAKTLTVEVGSDTYIMSHKEEPIKMWWEN